MRFSARLGSVRSSVFTDIAFDALNFRRRYHRDGLRALLDREPNRVLEPVAVGFRILDSLGRSGHPGILEVNLDHISLSIASFAFFNYRLGFPLSFSTPT